MQRHRGLFEESVSGAEMTVCIYLSAA